MTNLFSVFSRCPLRLCGEALLFLFLLPLAAQEAQSYLLGPDDQLIVRALDVEEFGKETPVRVDMRGNINLPLVGRIQAAGLTAEQVEALIARRLKTWVLEPQVTVQISEFRSQPVSILGAVNRPGVHQLQGRKNLFEIVSMAEGLKPDAGAAIKITRRKEWGPIPLPTAKADPTGEFSVAEVSVRSIMEARNPAENILVQPNDVISVPKADLVYVIGSVKRSGGFVLSERESISVLQALSLAEGLDRTAAPKNAKILRPVEGDRDNRQEIPVNLKTILEGKSADVKMAANDILFIPNNAAKSAALRGVEAAISLGTGIAIYRQR